MRDKIKHFRGSASRGNLKFFSDVDIEIYDKKKKPYYEIILFENKLVLLTIYFYNFVQGKKILSPANVKMLHGFFNNKIESDFSTDAYNVQEKIKRECQLTIDCMFKFMRTKRRDLLKNINKRI